MLESLTPRGQPVETNQRLSFCYLSIIDIKDQQFIRLAPKVQKDIIGGRSVNQS